MSLISLISRRSSKGVSEESASTAFHNNARLSFVPREGL